MDALGINGWNLAIQLISFIIFCWRDPDRCCRRNTCDVEHPLREYRVLTVDKIAKDPRVI